MSSTKPTLSASISDLAPFVAAVLKDKTVMDLSKDIGELRESEEERLLVEITGRAGTPVHYQASVKDGETDPYHLDLWNVWFEQKKNENGEEIVLPLNLIANIEVRLGGIVVSDLSLNSNCIDYDDCFFSVNEEDSENGYIIFLYRDNSISPIDYLVCRVGPVLYENYLLLIENEEDTGYLIDAINGSPDHFSFNQETPVNLTINGVEFNKEKIGMLLSIVERMGISTTRITATIVERMGISTTSTTANHNNH